MNNPIGKYLVHSYIYYQLDNSVISDGEYDKMAKHILENWDDLEHPHKHLISKDALQAVPYKQVPFYYQKMTIQQ